MTSRSPFWGSGVRSGHLGGLGRRHVKRGRVLEWLKMPCSQEWFGAGWRFRPGFWQDSEEEFLSRKGCGEGSGQVLKRFCDLRKVREKVSDDFEKGHKKRWNAHELWFRHTVLTVGDTVSL